MLPLPAFQPCPDRTHDHMIAAGVGFEEPLRGVEPRPQLYEGCVLPVTPQRRAGAQSDRRDSNSHHEVGGLGSCHWTTVAGSVRWAAGKPPSVESHHPSEPSTWPSPGDDTSEVARPPAVARFISSIATGLVGESCVAVASRVRAALPARHPACWAGAVCRPVARTREGGLSSTGHARPRCDGHPSHIGIKE